MFRTELVNIQRAAGTSMINEVLTSHGQLPSHVFIMPVASASVLGYIFIVLSIDLLYYMNICCSSYSHSPWKVSSDDLIHIELNVEGLTVGDISLDPSSLGLTKSYVKLMETSGWLDSNSSPIVTYERFVSGYNFGGVSLQRLSDEVCLSCL